MKWLGTQSRSALHSISKVFTFTHHNKLTSRIVSKPLMGLTTLNQALIHTPTPNLMGVIQSKSIISQAFQACYSIKGCPSDHCVLSLDWVGYRVRVFSTTQPLHLSASKVQWLELSQLSLCSEFDKENSMEFLLISLLLIHFTTVAMHLLSHGPHVTLVMWYTVTVTWHLWPFVTPLWHLTKSCDTFPHSIL